MPVSPEADVLSLYATLITAVVPSSPMTERKATKKRLDTSVIDRIPELLANALARNDDFIVTRETDEERGREKIHVISGKFVTACMLRKVLGQAESRRDEGAVIVSGKWQRVR
jgi:hypothetical protein